MIFKDELSKREHKMLQQRGSMLNDHENEKAELRHRLEEIKTNDSRTKDRLKEAASVCQ